MKHIVASLLLSLTVVACTDGNSMRCQLSELQACNQADSLLTNDSLALALTDYFDHHGTSNEQMLAHYLLGRTYADQGEAPAALDEFHQAAECADTTSEDCDYRLLARIHGQTANLFYSQMMPHEMLEQLECMESLALKDKDSLLAVYAIEWQHSAYDMLGDTLQALSSLESAHNRFVELGEGGLAKNCLPALIGYCVDLGLLSKAKDYIEEYESRTDATPPGSGIYCYFKGKYFLASGIQNSAEQCFREELKISTDPNDKEAAYDGLYHLYKMKGIADSVAKYADLCYQTSERRFQKSSSDKLRHMQSLYNYSRSQALAIRKTEEAGRNFRRFVLTGIFAILLLVAFGITFFVIQYRKRSELRRMRENYADALDRKEQAKQELILLQRQEFELLLKEKQKEIEQRQQDIDEMRKVLSSDQDIDSEFAKTEIYGRFVYLARNYNKRVYVEDWKRLYQMMDQVLPNFHSFIYSKSHIQEKDYRLCVLLRLNFSLPEIGVLLSEDSVYLSKRRKYLLLKLFDKEGKPELFDRLIKSIY